MIHHKTAWTCHSDVRESLAAAGPMRTPPAAACLRGTLRSRASSRLPVLPQRRGARLPTLGPADQKEGASPAAIACFAVFACTECLAA